jgi:hypothetical protein
MKHHISATLDTPSNTIFVRQSYSVHYELAECLLLEAISNVFAHGESRSAYPSLWCPTTFYVHNIHVFDCKETIVVKHI